MKSTCPECRADWSNGVTCEQDFHQFGFWELADLEHLGSVHHLMVLCYYLQHPSLYSPAGLHEARRLLAEFVERGTAPFEVRQRNRDRVDSGKRDWKITGTPTSHGSYQQPQQWVLTAVDVVAGGADNYCDNVRTWARLINEALRALP